MLDCTTDSAANPGFYGATFCVQCRTHLPVGKRGEFVWVNCDPRDQAGEGTLVGTMSVRPEDVKR